MYTAKFISLEGIDGAGKSTHLQFIKDYITNKFNVDVLTTCEPGGSVLGNEIRHSILHKDIAIDPRAELLLLFASRQQHISEVIIPNLERGTWVITDRYIDSSYAYQGYGRELGTQMLDTVSSVLCPLVMPNLTFWFDLDPFIASNRRKQSHSKCNACEDKIESSGYDFFNKARAGFYELWRNNPQRIKRIQTDADIATIRNDIKSYLDLLT